MLGRVLPDDVRVDGDPAAEREPGVALVRVGRRGEEQICVVDGPLEAEDEDAPADVAAVLLACRWTVQISLPASLAQAQHRLVVRLARALADAGRGVVFDPQEDAIVWPRNPRRVREVAAGDHDEDERAHVELELALARELTSEDAHTLLAILRGALPEAVPVRFGDYEPPQGRLERDGDEAFAALWDGGSGPFWRGLHPFDWGFVRVRRGWGSALPEAEREASMPELGGRKAMRTDGLRLEFHDAVLGDADWLHALAALFRRLCLAFDPFFAAAFHTPGPDDDDVVLQGRYWLGVPPSRFWLVFAGPPYAPLLPPGHPGAEALGRGVLVTLAGHPTDWDAIGRGRIDWPPELVRGGTQLEDDLAAEAIPDLTGP